MGRLATGLAVASSWLTTLGARVSAERKSEEEEKRWMFEKRNENG